MSEFASLTLELDTTPFEEALQECENAVNGLDASGSADVSGNSGTEAGGIKRKGVEKSRRIFGGKLWFDYTVLKRKNEFFPCSGLRKARADLRKERGHFQIVSGTQMQRMGPEGRTPGEFLFCAEVHACAPEFSTAGRAEAPPADWMVMTAVGWELSSATSSGG